MPSSLNATTSSPTWNAERLLLGLLDLIKKSNSIKDFSPQRVSEYLNEPVITFAPGHFGYGGKLTADWGFSFELKHTYTDRARLDLDFIDTTPEHSATATDICQVDFDRISSELERAGFSRSTTYGEHGRIIDDRFDRPGMNIKVVTMGEAPKPPEKARHICVLAITVQ